MIRGFASVSLLVVIILFCCEGKCASKKRYLLSYDKKTFYDALLECQRVDMELATIESPEEKEKTTANVIICWLGGLRSSDTADEFNWVSTSKKMIYSNFHHGEPNNAKGNEHCVNVYTTNNTIGWNDDNCDMVIHYMCQIPNHDSEITTRSSSVSLNSKLMFSLLLSAFYLFYSL
ncbi:lectin subunit alpha-like [Cylas formicarius]|uniref:lectin subunit alpha-like n=1 Tax=Cylas formicarius TaxID=197179 RepID=UPI002958BF2A|nr:lectin subunit alpha-like [Cylas formicarius]